MFELVATGLSKTYSRDGQVLRAVDGVDLRVGAGETIAVVGESGCGKSTLGMLLLGLLEPSAGSVTWNGRPLHSLDRAGRRQFRRDTAVVFQDPYSSLDPRMTIGRIVQEPLVTHDSVRGKALRRRAGELLDRVGIDAGLAGRHPHEFSGGQRQRIAIARALALRPRFVLFDEPTSALDVSVQAQVLNLIRELRAEVGIGYVFISHNLPVVRLVADELVVMYLGRIVEQRGGAEPFDDPLHPYTRALLASVPEPGVRREVPLRLAEAPDAAALPSGCRYHPRCPWAFEPCDVREPRLLEHRPRERAACHLVDRAEQEAIA